MWRGVEECVNEVETATGEREGAPLLMVSICNKINVQV